ncbi:hypothetical protein L3X38_003187 [Prunus dulcis]|uniref:Uncharacterized protein n=1 Tax=Prunus dulcis TaxID=3755 RepID=A0AAD5F1D7_PRUDU|nr:hypothetical protein L3X38_003187 [Prunus dulcis]
MSDLIRRCRAVTTTQSSEPPTQSTSVATAPASAATALALMDHLAVGPAGSQVPASSASSVAQPVSARRRHWPASTIDTTSTDASGSQPGALTACTQQAGPSRGQAPWEYLGDSAKILVESRFFCKWARHQGDVGNKDGVRTGFQDIPGQVLSAWLSEH